MKTRFFLAIVILFLFTQSVPAADNQAQSAIADMAQMRLIAQIALLLLVGRGLGEIMQRAGQPAVIGQLLAGLILGPSLFGWVWPQAYHLVFPNSPEQKGLITGIADIGVLMLLLVTGMELDLKLATKVGRPAVTVAAMGVIVPFACGFGLGEFLPADLLPTGGERLVAALFLGTALSISSIKIVAMVVRDMNFMRRDLGQIIVASAIIEDTVGWVIVAVTLGIAGAGGITAGSLARTVLGTGLFLMLSYTIGRTFVFKLIRRVNDHLVSEDIVITAILVMMLAMAMITQAIGVNTVLGAFVAGVLVGQSPIMSGEIEERLRGFITAFLMPVFFGLSGLGADLTILKNPELILLTAGLVVLASAGKFCGAFIGGWLGGVSRREALALGCAMNARGSTEVIVATIGLSMGVLTQSVYTMILTMAVVTTVAMPPLLRWALGRLPLAPEEEARLRREEIDAQGFVSKIERVLVAADDSDSGAFAIHLAGFLAGQHGNPMTVLHVDQKEASGKLADIADAKDRLGEVAKESARVSSEVAKQERDGAPAHDVEVIARAAGEDVAQAVAEEAEKGFDLMFIGLDKMRDGHGAFSDAVTRAAAGFKGPLVLVSAGEARAARASKQGLNVLVAVNGTEVSRYGAELAFALAPPKDTIIEALHVPEHAGLETEGGKRGTRRKTETAILNNVTELGDRYGFEVRASVQRHASPVDAILRQAARMHADMVVIGAHRRVGETLFLGRTVATLLQRWNGQLVILAI